MKTCTKCGKEKPEGEFANVYRKLKDGTVRIKPGPRCKTCRTEHNREYHREYRKTHKRVLTPAQTARNKMYQKMYQKQWRENNRDKKRLLNKRHYERKRVEKIAAGIVPMKQEPVLPAPKGRLTPIRFEWKEYKSGRLRVILCKCGCGREDYLITPGNYRKEKIVGCGCCQSPAVRKSNSVRGKKDG